MIRIRLFGTTEVWDLGRGAVITEFRGIKERQILAILALYVGQPLAKTRLAKLLWDDHLPDSWHSTLEGYVSLLRRCIEPGVRPSRSMISTQRGSYCLRPDGISSDLAEFDALVAEAAPLAPADALPRLRSALLLARGEVLADERWTWAGDIRHRYRAKVVNAAVRAARHAVTLGDVDTATDLAQRACDLDPLAEDAWTLLMAAHWLAGRRTDGLRCFAGLRTVLADELGIAPGRRAQRLHLLISRDEPPAVHLGSTLDDRFADLPLVGAAPAHD